MKKIFFSLIISSGILSILAFFAWNYENKFFPIYRELYNYRRLRPELFPSSEMMKITSIGHFLSNADISWVNLIQFVGDNVGNGKYLDFSHHLLKNITDLSPYFYKAYETDLLFTPLVFADSQDDITPDDREKITRTIEHGKEGMQIFCNQDLIQEISKIPFGNKLWNRQDLKNPCKNGMIPYYIGFHYSNDLLDNTGAAYYYKIASMQDDAPDATKFLGPIAEAQTGDPLDAAVSFLLIARDGYDIEPYECRVFSNKILAKIQYDRSYKDEWIRELVTTESHIKDTKDNSNIDSLSVNNCYDSLRRGLKQIYMGYITKKAENYPEILNAKELLQKDIIPFIPTIKGNETYTLRKKNGKWLFRNY